MITRMLMLNSKYAPHHPDYLKWMYAEGRITLKQYYEARGKQE